MRELNIVVLGCSFLLPLLQRRHLLCMLPVEVWQEVLGFCACDEYTRLVGLRRVDETVKWRAQPASRELYFVLKHSLLEMRFHTMLPSASLGGCGWRRVAPSPDSCASCDWVGSVDSLSLRRGLSSSRGRIASRHVHSQREC